MVIFVVLIARNTLLWLFFFNLIRREKGEKEGEKEKVSSAEEKKEIKKNYIAISSNATRRLHS